MAVKRLQAQSFKHSSKYTLWRAHSTLPPYPQCPGLLLSSSCSLAKVKVGVVQMGAWEKAGGGELEQAESRGCQTLAKEPGVASQSGVQFHPREEVSGRDCQGDHSDKTEGLTVKSKRPDTRLKATKWTVALLVKSWPRTAILGLILILSFREIFSSEFLYEHCFLVVLFTLKRSCISVSLGRPYECS